MEKKIETTDKREIYVAPVCECVEVEMEGMLCSSDKHGFDTVGDDFGVNGKPNENYDEDRKRFLFGDNGYTGFGFLSKWG